MKSINWYIYYVLVIIIKKDLISLLWKKFNHYRNLVFLFDIHFKNKWKWPVTQWSCYLISIKIEARYIIENKSTEVSLKFYTIFQIYMSVTIYMYKFKLWKVNYLFCFITSYASHYILNIPNFFFSSHSRLLQEILKCEVAKILFRIWFLEGKISKAVRKFECFIK